MHHQTAATTLLHMKNKTLSYCQKSLYTDDTPLSATVWKTITETNCGLVVSHRDSQLAATLHYILPLAQLKVLLILVRLWSMDLVRMPSECSGPAPCSYVPILDPSQLPLQQLDSLALSEDDSTQGLHFC